ncbi:hypothetical protein D3C76_1372160 [compost metagenome]
MGERSQYLIAGQMAVGIIDLFKVINIDQQQRHRFFRFIFVLQHFTGFTRQCITRQDARKEIMIGTVLQAPQQLTVNRD